jgi:hypothetical protein
VSVQGWFRRSPQPAIELRRAVAADGRQATSYVWLARWAGSTIVLAAGGVALVLGLAHA